MLSKASLRAWYGSEAGERDFAALYQAELPRIYNFFRYRVGDGPQAEDLTSETFEKAWRKRHHYRRDLSAFSTWLYTIARNVAVDYYRKHRVEAPLEAVAGLSDEQTGAESLEEVAARRADIERLPILLARLSDRDRELVALRYGAGLTNRTIAGLTGLRESNVGVILHRALQQLRAEWETQP
jgi:RNA polymerase sigma-70 factor, ECF subfamily